MIATTEALSKLEQRILMLEIKLKRIEERLVKQENKEWNSK